jgi:hypothetical protein
MRKKDLPMNSAQTRWFSDVLAKWGFHESHSFEAGNLEMVVFNHDEVDDEIHVMTSDRGIVRVLACHELAATCDGTNPNLDDVITELEQFVVQHNIKV